MALEGSLSDFGLADILQLVYFQKKTGTLTLAGRMDRVRLLFVDGNIVSAESQKRLEESRLGRILFKKGLLREEDLRLALDEQKRTGARIGDLLIQKGLVSAEEVKSTLVSQITETVVQLFSWKEGTYEFQVQPVAESRDMPVSLDTQHLLMDGLRIIDEWSVIEGKITLDTVFSKAEAGEGPFTPLEENLLRFVDGDNDVSIIVELSGVSDFEATKALVGLLERGVIEPVEIMPVVAKAPKPAGPGVRVMRQLPAGLLFASLVVALLFPALWKGGGLFSAAGIFRTLSAARDVEVLRFRAEEFLYRTGSYPDDLAKIGAGADPWGGRYLYRVEKDGILIVSKGPDGRAGTADDVY